MEEGGGGWGRVGMGGWGDKKPSNKLRQSDYITGIVFEPLWIVRCRMHIW